MKRLFLDAPYGTVPLLEVNGQYLAETVAISRFLGKKFKLNGANEWENAKCDEFVDAVTDFSRCETSIRCSCNLFKVDLKFAFLSRSI